jgi:AcrR family transcriptional regulator
MGWRSCDHDTLMPKVSEAHLTARRDQILDAATTCFARDGLHQTTLRQICAEAGLSAGAVYGYFQSKTEILEAVFARYAAQHTGHAPPASVDVVVLLSETLGRLPQMVEDPALERDHRLSLMLLGEALLDPRLAASYAELNRRAVERIAPLLEKAQAQGALSPELDTRGLAQVFLAAYQGFRAQRFMDPTLDAARFGRNLRALFEGLLSRR